jgi:hypothetical protein
MYDCCPDLPLPLTLAVQRRTHMASIAAASSTRRADPCLEAGFDSEVDSEPL